MTTFFQHLPNSDIQEAGYEDPEAGHKVLEEGHKVLEASYGVSEAGWGAREAGYGVSTRRDFPLPAHYSTTPLCRIASTLQSTLDPSRLEEVKVVQVDK